jgi:hypothetical protein
MVYGPIAHHVESIAELNTSSKDIYRLFNGSEKAVPETDFWAYADVRDGKKISTSYFNSFIASLRFSNALQWRMHTS